jgi:HPt (histidine-containing phosphotransfer) domain-containing protein
MMKGWLLFVMTRNEMSYTSEERVGSAQQGPGAAGDGGGARPTSEPPETRTGPGERPEVPTAALLRRLARDLGDDPVVVEQFVTDYLSLLGPRLERLAQLLAAGDDEALVVSILSLESSSAMIGADQVAGAAHALRVAVPGRPSGDARSDADRQLALRALELAAAAARSALTELGFHPRP